MRLPRERKLWTLRKYVYGGLPPNDPRILALTDEQIELEFGHMKLDNQLKSGNKEFEDEEFDKYDQESEEDDSKDYEATLFDEQAAIGPGAASEVKKSDERPYDPAEWEDIETDDLNADEEDNW